ncbi:hypothetical protein [Streptomyces sp. NPDC050535]|uniref:hypothetical protein n=1 Tax=Streptomyces sp. NPDC050535 TaxID=3365626 RepID=UPI0037A1DB48
MHQQPHRYVERRGANHGLHVFLTIISCGLWAVTGWPIAAAMGRKTVTTGYAPPQQQVPPQQPYGYPPQQGYPPTQYGQQPTQYGPPPGETPP